MPFPIFKIICLKNFKPPQVLFYLFVPQYLSQRNLARNRMEEKEILIEIQNEQEKEEREGTESKNLEMLSERERERE